MGVIDLKKVTQPGCKILGRTAITSLEKPAGSDAQPPRNLVEPGTLFGRTMEDRLMAWSAQEGPALRPMAQVLGPTGHLAPSSAQPAHRKAPVALEILHHPSVAVHVWQWLDDVGQLGGEIGTGAGLAQMPHAVPRWYHKRSEQRRTPCRMYAGSHLAGFPGALGGVEYWRWRIGLPVFSSGHMPTRPCSKKRRAFREKEQISCAWAAQSGAGLFRQ